MTTEILRGVSTGFDVVDSLPDVVVTNTEWFDTPIRDYMQYVEGHGRESPFDLPGNVDSYICLQENDYLRLSKDERVRSAQAKAAMTVGAGKMSAGVFQDAESEGGRLCRCLAESMCAERVILATSGWAANVGLVEAIAPPGSPIYIDMGVHPSLSDGARLSKGRTVFVAHNKPRHLERRVRRDGPGIVIVDAFYSMDGSVCDLQSYVEICERYGCVMVLDEAHSFGLVGAKGGGLAVACGLQDRIRYRTGSLSKALGGHGGFVAGKRTDIEHVRFRSRSIIFSSSPAEVLAAGNRAALEIVMSDNSRGERCLRMAQVLRHELAVRGIESGRSQCQIVCVWFKANYTATRLYWELRQHGVLASVFAPPAVPWNRSMIRFSVHACVTEPDMVKTTEATCCAIDRLGVWGDIRCGDTVNNADESLFWKS